MSGTIFKSNEIGEELFRIGLTHLMSFKENRYLFESKVKVWTLGKRKDNLMSFVLIFLFVSMYKGIFVRLKAMLTEYAISKEHPIWQFLVQLSFVALAPCLPQTV